MDQDVQRSTSDAAYQNNTDLCACAASITPQGARSKRRCLTWSLGLIVGPGCNLYHLLCYSAPLLSFAPPLRLAAVSFWFFLVDSALSAPSTCRLNSRLQGTRSDFLRNNAASVCHPSVLTATRPPRRDTYSKNIGGECSESLKTHRSIRLSSAFERTNIFAQRPCGRPWQRSSKRRLPKEWGWTIHASLVSRKAHQRKKNT